MHILLPCYYVESDPYKDTFHRKKYLFDFDSGHFKTKKPPLCKSGMLQNMRMLLLIGYR
jgi:hypothetical protein